MRIAWRSFLAGCLFASVAVAVARGGSELPDDKRKASDDDLRIRGVFDSVLPRTEKKNSLRFILHPHLGDLTKKDHIRTVLGFRYGLTPNWEASAETDAYFTHGLRNGAFFNESGFSTLHLGTKYNLKETLIPGWESSIGLDWLKPIGQPPIDVTDGLRHLIPFVSFSHQLESHPAWRVFTGVSWDDVTSTSTRGQLEKDQLGEDSIKLSGGFVYARGPLTYTLEATYTTTRLTSSTNQDVYSLRPGIIWVLPSQYTFGSQSKWLLGIGTRLSHGPAGNDIGLNAKLRINFDLKRLLGLKKSTPPGT